MIRSVAERAETPRLPQRSSFYPSDAPTVGELRYLERRYPTRADREERAERLADILRRLTRDGKPSTPIHKALHAGIRLWETHATGVETRAEAKRRHLAIEKARRDVARAVRSVRRLLPSDAQRYFRDESLFPILELLATDPGSPPSARVGRPIPVWKYAAESALQDAGVGASDRRELLSALGFLDDED